MARECRVRGIALRVTNGHKEIDHNATDASNRETTPDIREEYRDQNNIPAEEDPTVPPDPEPQDETSPENIALRDRILEVMLLEERARLPSLKACDGAQLRAEVGKVNEAVKRIETQNIAELNLMYAATYVTTERMGMLKKRNERKTEEPFWKRRI